MCQQKSLQPIIYLFAQKGGKNTPKFNTSPNPSQKGIDAIAPNLQVICLPIHCAAALYICRPYLLCTCRNAYVLIYRAHKNIVNQIPFHKPFAPNRCQSLRQLVALCIYFHKKNKNPRATHNAPFSRP